MYNFAYMWKLGNKTDKQTFKNRNGFIKVIFEERDMKDERIR